MKAVLIAIQPKGCAKIANGEKTIEVRKTRPTIETPFKCYIYCTKGKKTLIDLTKDGEEDYWGNIYHGKPIITSIYMPSYLCASTEDCRCKVIGEFVCGKIYDIVAYDEFYGTYYGWNFDFSLSDTCLSEKEFEEYLSKKSGSYLKPLNGFGWHISDFKIYDKPKELIEFNKEKINCFKMPCQCCKFYHEEKDGLFACDNILTRPPQSWCYVEELEEER